MSDDRRLLMIGAMYENGGNTTHRLLDGHEQLLVYPFESQLGTSLVTDMLSATFPAKYRWPVFALDATPRDDYMAIIDEECKVRTRTPQVSKFRNVPLEMSDEERLEAYLAHVERSGRSRPNNVKAFFRATFETWKNLRTSGREVFYVGYSPIITVDAEQILMDVPDSQFLHIVRNPWSAYADTKKRAVPLGLDQYMLGWSIAQHFALTLRDRYAGRMHVLRLEDILQDPVTILGDFCRSIGLERSGSLAQPSWNGGALDQVYPWGTIRDATPAANEATAGDLSDHERQRVREGAGLFLDALGYTDFVAR